jgi:hypothetical protein
MADAQVPKQQAVRDSDFFMCSRALEIAGASFHAL